MELDSEVKLGQSTSLLFGYKADIFYKPFLVASNKPALFEKPVTVKSPDYDVKWSWPTISLHENVDDLLSAVFQVKLRPVSFEDNPSEGGVSAQWPPGPLILAGLTNSARQIALRNLSKQLGIDLSRSEQSFALVRKSRKVGTAIHPCYERGMFGNPDPDNTIRSDTLAALKSLEKLAKTSTDVSMEGANGYLSFFETYGTHFVSKIDFGDSIFQVFAFAKKEFNDINQIYLKYPEELSGPSSTSFVTFTTPRNEAGYGYTAAIGNICIVSEDPEMATSLRDGLWLDNKFAVTNSIFTPSLRSGAVDANKVFKKIAPISFELASLETFAEYYRMLIWRRVFKGAMYTKYANGSGVAPYFSNNCPYDLDLIYKESTPLDGDGLLSTLATPTVNIWQEQFDLSKFVLQFPELVKTFSVFANAIQISTSDSKDKTAIDVPGSSSTSLLGHVISSGSTGPVPPTLRLKNSSFNKIKDRLYCGEFYGGLRIINIDGSKMCVVMNGLLFEVKDGTVAVVCDVRAIPSSSVLTKRLTDIGFALAAAEARLNFLLSNTTRQAQSLDLMKKFLFWLAGVSSRHDKQNDHLASLEARALYLASVASKDQESGIPVPYLKYEAYKDVVSNVQKVLETAAQKLTNFQKQIRDRKAEEREIERESVLNNNIISSGKLLQDYIQTQASYQQSMQQMFLSVIEEKESQMDLASKQIDKLNTSLKEQRAVVNDAITEYQDAVAEWQKKETIKAAFDIASNIFSLGFAFVTPSTTISALASLGKTVQKIQKMINVFNAVIKAYRSIKALPSNPQKVVSALKDIGPSGLETPSSLEWDEMKVNFDTALSQGPDIAAKKSLSAAFSILVLRGKALLQSQGIVQKIAADLSAAKQRNILHEEQKKRLDGLKIKLHAQPEKLDVAKIDLIGLSGQLLFFQRQMLMTLASTVVIQDRALQYEYLRPPTPIESFSMLNLQTAILNQSQSINKGLTVQPLPKYLDYPIIYEIHGVRPESITNNQQYSFDISINKLEFAPYNYVRVKKIDVELGGIVSSKSGKYYTELVFNGNPFFDRGFNGETLEYQTTSHIFTGLHEVSSSSHEYSDGSDVVENPVAYVAATGQDPFGDKVSDITPFSRWQISLPKSQSNEDIKFDDDHRGVTVRLIFHLYAQLKESNISPREMHRNALSLISRKVNAQATDITATPDIISTEKVLDMMSGKSVCAGWDAVFSMTGEQVNEQLRKQYDDRKGNPRFLRSTGYQKSETTTSEGLKTKTEFNIEFDAPRLEFLLNNSESAQVFLPILSGNYKYSIFANGSWILVSQADVKSTDNSFIQGDVPFAILPGSVSSQHKVVIKLKGGAFSALNFNAGVSNPMLRTVLTDYFTSLKDGYEVYCFGILDFQSFSVLDSLKPSAFKFNVYHTASRRDLLQLFIATTGALEPDTSLYLQEPIPSQYECSLIINSKIFFQSVLPTTIGDGGIGFVLESIEPKDDSNKDKVWSSKASAGSIVIPYPATKIGGSTTYVKGSTIHIESYIRVDNDRVVLNLDGMRFENGDGTSIWDVKEAYQLNNKSYDFQYGSRSKTVSPFTSGSWTSIDYKDYSLKVSVDVNSNLKLSISGSGQNQSVGIDSSPSSVNFQGNLEPPAGACETNDRELQKKFFEKLKSSLPDKLVNLFNHKFESVSLFALKNLLFPAKNVIDMKKAYVPGDMVIFGNFT